MFQQDGPAHDDQWESQLEQVNQEGGSPSYVVASRDSQEDVILHLLGSPVSQEGMLPSYVDNSVGSQEGVLPSYTVDSSVCQETELPSHMVDNGVSQDCVLPSYVVNNVCQEGLLRMRTTALNANAEVFVAQDPSKTYQGRLGVSLLDDFNQVQRVQAGGVGLQDDTVAALWNTGTSTGCRSGYSMNKIWSHADMPFSEVESIPDVLGIAPKQIQKVSKLLDLKVKMQNGTFVDKVLPAPDIQMKANNVFTPDYFAALHQITAAPGLRADGTPYPAHTPNHVGARISLPHTKLHIDRWRAHLRGYENAELVQFLEYGFPLGLENTSKLESQTRNHGSS